MDKWIDGYTKNIQYAAVLSVEMFLLITEVRRKWDGWMSGWMIDG